MQAQQQALAKKLLGHFGYYGITGNFRALQCFVDEVRRVAQVAVSPLAMRT